MDKRYKHSLDIKIRAAELYSSGFGYKSVASLLQVPRSTSRVWRDKFQAGELLGLGVMSQKSYSFEVKLAAVEAFVAGSSVTEVVARFGISNRGVFNKWLAIYRAQGPAGLESKPKGRPVKAVSAGAETLEEEVFRLRLENAVLKKLEALMIEGDPRFWEKPTSSNR